MDLLKSFNECHTSERSWTNLNLSLNLAADVVVVVVSSWGKYFIEDISLKIFHVKYYIENISV